RRDAGGYFRQGLVHLRRRELRLLARGLRFATKRWHHLAGEQPQVLERAGGTVEQNVLDARATQHFELRRDLVGRTEQRAVAGGVQRLVERQQARGAFLAIRRGVRPDQALLIGEPRLDG